MKNRKSYLNLEQLKSNLFWFSTIIILMWSLFLMDYLLPLQWMGLVPRQISGLKGIVGMAFIHANWSHLLSNTVILIILFVLLAGTRANARLVIIYISLIGGLLLWIIGRDALHIGASLLIFGIASFLVVIGFVEKRVIPIIISFLVIGLYGSSLVKGLLPFQGAVSWEGHLSGLVAGVIVAFVMAKRK